MAVHHTEDAPHFKRTLHLEVTHAPEFLEYVNMASDYIAHGELHVRMQFNDREAILIYSLITMPCKIFS